MKETVDEKVEKYLGEASEKEAAKKLEKVIKSIDSEKQVETAVNMIVRFAKMYGKDFFDMTNMKRVELTEKYLDKLAVQLGKKHQEGKISKDAIQQVGAKLGIQDAIDKYVR